jgi:hypothetical protein
MFEFEEERRRIRLQTLTFNQKFVPLLAYVYAEDDEHGKQGKSKKKCHSVSV